MDEQAFRQRAAAEGNDPAEIEAFLSRRRQGSELSIDLPRGTGMGLDPEPAPLNLHPKAVPWTNRETGETYAVPVDESQEGANPAARMAIMNTEMSNDEIADAYEKAGHPIARDETGRVYLVDLKTGRAHPMINENAVRMTDYALPAAMGIGGMAAGGPAGAEAEGFAGAPLVRWAGRTVLGRGLKAAAGQFIGEEATRGALRAGSGLDIPMDPKGAAGRAAFSGGLQAGMEGAGRAFAGVGGVSPRVANETLRAGPIERVRMTRPFGIGVEPPGETMPELALSGRIQGQVERTMGATSPSRLAAEKIVADATKQGVRIPLAKTMPMISNLASKTPLGRPEKVEARALGELWNDIAEGYLRPRTKGGQPMANAALKGSVTPEQADRIRMSLWKLAKFENDKPTLFQKAARQVYKTFREEFYGALKPLGEEAVKTKAFMDTMEELAARIRGRNPESFVRGMFGWDAIDKQSNLAALRQAEEFMGTGGSLEKDIRRLAAQHQWSDADRGLAARLGRQLLEVPKVGLVMGAARPVGKFLTLGGRAAAPLAVGLGNRPEVRLRSPRPGVYVSGPEAAETAQ